MIRFRYAAASDVGRRRAVNEDSAYASPRLLAVADGMGGHLGGHVASAIVIDCLARLDESPRTVTLRDLAESIRLASHRLRDTARRNPMLTQMGSTLTAMSCATTQTMLAHVGDSRAYVLRDGRLTRLTNDHTFVQALVDDGHLTPEQAAVHPHRSVLTKVLDGGDTVEPDLFVHTLRPADRVLLCSDGLSGVVDLKTIEQVINISATPDAAVRELIGLALLAGGPDNITCIVAHVVETAHATGDAPATSMRLGAAARPLTQP